MRRIKVSDMNAKTGPTGPVRNGLSQISVVLTDEVPDFRTDQRAPATSGENPVMPTVGCGELLLEFRGNFCAQRLSRMGLALAGNIVQFALNGEQGYAINILWAHLFAMHVPLALGQAVLLEHNADRVQIERGGHIQHGIVFVVETAVCLCVVISTLDRMLIKVV